MIRFFILFFVLIPAFSQAGFSFVLKQRIELADDADCGAILEEAYQIIFPDRELLDWRVYSSGLCDVSLPKELNLLVVFEGPEDRLRAHFDSLARSRIAGVLLQPKSYESVFVDTYYLAIKSESNGSLKEISGFEKPVQFANFKAAIAHKDELKQTLMPMSAEQIRQHLQAQLSPKVWRNWKENVIPLMSHLQLQFHIYFLIGNDQSSVKAPVYGFTKQLGN